MDAVAGSLGALSKPSNLAKQIKKAVKVRGQRQRSERSAGKSPSASLTAWGAKGDMPQDSHVRPASGWGVVAWAAAGLLLLAGALGVVITLQTKAGQLVIETATPNVEVRVLKAGRPYRQLTIQQRAETLRLGAGEYEIEIVSAADGLEIENGTYTLKRGETWLAKIVHRESGNNKTDPR
jgi:hypothetical protein